jgi:hypothetical protein
MNGVWREICGNKRKFNDFNGRLSALAAKIDQNKR